MYHIENEGAYESGRTRCIKRNAAVGFRRDYADAEKIEIYVMSRGVIGRDSRGNATFADTYIGRLAQYMDSRGRLFDSQVVKVREMMARDDARRIERDAPTITTDGHVGTVGKRQTFAGTVARVFEYESDFGLQRIVVIMDDQNRAIVYKGASLAELTVGASVTMIATVKSHGTRDGVPQTFIARPASVEITNHGV